MVVDVAGPGVVLVPVGDNTAVPVVGEAGCTVAGVEVAPGADGVDDAAGVAAGVVVDVVPVGGMVAVTGVKVADGLGEGVADGPVTVVPPHCGAVTTLVSRVTAPFSA